MEFFDMAKGVLSFTPTISMELVGWESDDVIGTLVRRYHSTHDITVETNDGDFWQLSDKCHLPLVSKKWHKFSPDTCLLYKALVGESKDNVTGLQGFGPASWEHIPEKQRQQLVSYIKLDKYLDFQDEIYPLLPPRVRKKHSVSEAWNEICLCWKLNSFWDVPTDEIDAAMKVGKQNFAAAEIYLENFLI